MNTSQPQLNSPPEGDLELLSAYIDQQLDPPARAALERRLQVEPRLRADLEELKATAALLRDLPPLPPPRSFTLDPAKAPRRGSFLPLAWFMQFGGGLAGLVLVLLASLQMLSGVGGMMASSAPAPMLAPVMAPAATAAPMAVAPLPTATAAAAPTQAPLAAVMSADTAHPDPTEAPTAAATAAFEAAPPTTGAEAARQAVSPPSATGGLGAGAPAPNGPAEAFSPTAAISTSSSPMVGLSNQDTSTATPAAKAAPQPVRISPGLLLGLGVVLLGMAFGAFLYRRSHR